MPLTRRNADRAPLGTEPGRSGVTASLLGLVLALSVPLAALSYSAYGTSSEQISLVRSELSGLDSLTPVRQLLEAQLRLEGELGSLVGRETAGLAALHERMMAERDQLVEIVVAGDGDAGILGGTADARRHLYDVWSSERGASSSGVVTDQTSAMAEATFSVLRAVADTSGLQQDPSPRSYYLALALASTLPDVIETASNLASFAQSTLRTGSFTAEARTRLIALTTLLEQHDRSLAEHLSFATSDDPPATGDGLAGLLMRARAPLSRLLDQGEKAGRDAVVKPRPSKVASTVSETLAMHFAVWDMASQELDTMLVSRRNRLVNNQRAAAASLLVVIGIVVALVLKARRDMRARRLAEKALAHQAAHDPLTGLPNRRMFVERLEQACHRADRTGTLVAVLFVDLDDFKHVNDRYGHDAGDRLLLGVADRLRGAVRAEDTPARLGGDEFAVVLEDMTSSEDAQRVANAVLCALTDPVERGDDSVAVHCSIGVAVSEGRGTTGEDLLRDADSAMYAAKHRGKGTIAVFDPAADGDAAGERAVMADLLGASERGELHLHYQPIVELGTTKIAGVEALLRWQHPEAGNITPDRFIPYAERSGQIIGIGRWVIEQACEQAAAWRRDHPEMDLFVSVNVAAAQLTAPDLVDNIRTVLTRTGLSPDALILEFTESAAISQGAPTTTRLAELKALGVRLAIDDFGTGYSSLSYLTLLPVDVLKVDKHFVDRLDGDPAAAALMQKVIELGTALGFVTVAEGIEQREQVDALRSFDCGLGQGFLFARPSSPAGIDALLRGSTIPTPDAVPSLRASS